MSRVKQWAKQYPESVKGFADADGVAPKHTFFYPQEQYDAECLNALSALCRDGCGEVEIHLHHRNDTADGLRQKIIEFRDCLQQRHGLLGRDAQGYPGYGFVHGNWSLCNSRPDGDWCGVNEELTVLHDTGCYADFTFPSAPSPTQPRTVNAIYRACDTPGKPRGHDRGEIVKVQAPHHGDTETPVVERSTLRASGLPRRSPECTSTSGRRRVPPWFSSLMLVPGPLGLDWRRRKWGLLPRLENGEISAANPPTAARAELWVRQQVRVVGRPEWTFVKVHTHGCVDANAGVLFSEQMRGIHGYLNERYNDGAAWRLHYVTAREMFNMVRAAEDGKRGEPGEYRDYEIVGTF